MHQSIATIDSPEFINLQPLDVNPLMSSCEIKVLYIGENRNHSYITKEVASDMAKTLRGAPIVGYYKEEKEDFADHGERVIFDDEGVKFECLTKPYGFVAPDAKVWFQKFEDTDDFGNVITREYLMTTGYLWTEQYKECKEALQEGKEVQPKVFAHQIAYNVIPHIGSFLDNGYTSEEMKMQNEGRKIMHLPSLKVTCTCVRVPVIRSHSISLTVVTKDKLDIDDVKKAIAKEKGCVLTDDPLNNVYPMPIDTSDQDEVFVGRIRQSIINENGIALWCCGDQVRKGAATNAIQIAELFL